MRERGFTLLELLIAMTILSLIAVILGVSVRLGIRTWERGKTDADNSRKIRYFVARLGQQIKSAYSYQIEVNGERVVAFQGRSDSIFFATSSVKASEGGLKWISYFIRDGNLIMREGVLPDKRIMERISKEGHVFDMETSGLKFQYFSSKEKGWKESWDSKTDLPVAIKIHADKIPSVIISIPSGFKDEKE
ncbi:MAG: type II secretion system protein [Nitrospiraceae bacterium]|nr:type II secretion system protein [Nitrospiraceae bacterium]